MAYFILYFTICYNARYKAIGMFFPLNMSTWFFVIFKLFSILLMQIDSLARSKSDEFYSFSKLRYKTAYLGHYIETSLIGERMTIDAVKNNKTFINKKGWGQTLNFKRGKLVFCVREIMHIKPNASWYKFGNSAWQKIMQKSFQNRLLSRVRKGWICQ